MITFESVCFSYPEKAVVKDFSMQIGKGERVRLTGASGAGKTTVLRLILGLETPQSGRIKREFARASVLFQEDRLMPFYTVLENLALFCPAARAKELLRTLEIGDAAGLYPSQLSGGMARRVALARALCLDADLYLFDEPFTGLDEDARRVCLDAILRETKGKTLVLINHGEFSSVPGAEFRPVGIG